MGETDGTVNGEQAGAWQPLRALTLLEIVTVGLPFCVFKVACGLFALGFQGWAWLGWALIAWGAVDTALNVLNALTVGSVGRRWLPVCLLQALTRAVRPTPRGSDLGIAMDMMLSFVLVAVMIGSGSLGRLAPEWLSAWNLAVVLNVLGAGALRLAETFRR
jgi:hypothetical protein